MRWTFAGLVFLAVMGLAAYFVFTQAVKGGGYVLVPDLSGLSITQAANLLADVGLELGTQKQVLSEVPEYHVIVQRPNANRVVRLGRKVSLTISAGGQVEETPRLVGKSLESVLNELEGTRLRAGSIARVQNEAAADVILAQDPEPRAAISVGGEIHLLVSAGPASQELLMPNILGKPLDDAQLTLAGLDVVVIPYKVNRSGAEYEIVLGQLPPAGTRLSPGAEVSFDVRLLPSSFLPNARRLVEIKYRVPNLSGQHAIRVMFVDHTGLARKIYPLPKHSVDGRPPLNAGNSRMTVEEEVPSKEATFDFFVDGVLHTSYYFEGDAEPVVTVNEAFLNQAGTALVKQEDLEDTRKGFGGLFNRRKARRTSR